MGLLMEEVKIIAKTKAKTKEKAKTKTNKNTNHLNGLVIRIDGKMLRKRIRKNTSEQKNLFIVYLVCFKAHKIK